MKIKNVYIEDLENPGCNNGNYPRFTAINAATGEKVVGQTCNCLAGCSSMDRLEDYDPKTGTATFVET